jgi:predicted AAA+ superfamily ATPase
MIIQRTIAPHLKKLAQQFSAVAVLGPRQSGKTTLVKDTFPNHAYVTLEDIDTKMIAHEDPRGFLQAYSQYEGVIIDEAQEVPELFSYMQGVIDKEYKPGFFILTGSQNFLMHEKITQTLAGRIALLTLLPLSVHELEQANLLPDEVESLMIKGFYPQLYTRPIDVRTWCANYINTYVEKDVRQLLKITDVLVFGRFLKLCAARIGNLINYAELARDCDISPHTAKQWISILETSYIIKLLSPYYRNFSKRVTQHPKLYFYDSSLACQLLNIRTNDELFNHPLRGALFESFVISEFFKYNYNNNESPQIYFWRDARGHEIDCIIEKSYTEIIPIEIKASKTVATSFFDGLVEWKTISNQEDVTPYVVYGGPDSILREKGHIYSWKAINQMLQKMYARK